MTSLRGSIRGVISSLPSGYEFVFRRCLCSGLAPRRVTSGGGVSIGAIEMRMGGTVSGVERGIKSEMKVLLFFLFWGGGRGGLFLTWVFYLLLICCL